MAAEALAHPQIQAHRRAGKYLTFRLHNESYGVDVLQIREIIRTSDITAVPQMPAYVRGVTNLRGRIIPVLDLGLRLGFPLAADNGQNCIIVVQVQLPNTKPTQMGLVVDGVEEVANIAEEDIEETPDFGANIPTDYIVGLAKIKGAVKTLLDINGILSAGEINSLQRAPTTP